MSNFIDYIYKTFLYEPSIYLVKLFANEKYGIFILIFIIVVLSLFQSKLIPKLSQKFKFLSGLMNFLIGVIFVLLLAVSFFKYGPGISDWFKSTNTQTTTPGNNSGATTQKQKNTAPVYQPPKQLYYSVGCSGCYAETCPRNGYSYGGYNSSYYDYYRNLCRACSCTDYRAQSLWR